MAQTIADTPASLLPLTLFKTLSDAASLGFCRLDKMDGSQPIKVSSYKFLEELSTNPALQAEWWKMTLVDSGIGLTALAGMGALVAVTGPFAPFTALGAMIAAPFFGGNRIATLIVCNGTGGDMVLKDIYQDCGVQTARPVYSERNPTTDSVIATKPNTIPGRVELLPGLKQAGIGIYRFEKNLDWGLGFYGTGGAISWSFGDAKIGTTMAAAWLTPEKGDLGWAVTADLSQYSSLQDFYEKTADTGAKRRLASDGKTGGPSIRIGPSPRNRPDDDNWNDAVYTIEVRA